MSSALFSPPLPVDIEGLSILEGTCPFALVYRSLLYLFWNSSKKDGISYATFDGREWSNAQSCRKGGAKLLGIAPETDPAAVVFQDCIYLFYHGVGLDGAFLTVFDGQWWSPIASLSDEVGEMSIKEGDSPHAIVFEDVIHLFWQKAVIDDSYDDGSTSKSGDYWYSVNLATFDGISWITGELSSGPTAYASIVPTIHEDALHLVVEASRQRIKFARLCDDGWKWSTLRSGIVPSRSTRSSPDQVSVPACTLPMSSKGKTLVLFVTDDGPTVHCGQFGDDDWAFTTYSLHARKTEVVPGEALCCTAVAYPTATDDSLVFWVNQRGRCFMTGCRAYCADDLKLLELSASVQGKEKFQLYARSGELCKLLLDAYRQINGADVQELSLSYNGVSPVLVDVAEGAKLASWYENVVDVPAHQIAVGHSITAVVINALKAGFAIGLYSSEAGTSFVFHPEGRAPPTRRDACLPDEVEQMDVAVKNEPNQDGREAIMCVTNMCTEE